MTLNLQKLLEMVSEFTAYWYQYDSTITKSFHHHMLLMTKSIWFEFGHSFVKLSKYFQRGKSMSQI